MKILFLCGSAEPGKDGVGDYTRRLCGELLRIGHQAEILTLYDKHAVSCITENQKIDDIQVVTHRIPFLTQYKQRLEWTKAILNTLQPDWISLQFVPYSFDPKGLPFWFPKFLKELKGAYQWHIMFHELWVGISVISPLKHKLTGFFQRYIAKRIVYAIAPSSITTSNVLYQLVLRKGAINADILSLFSNIPKVAVDLKFRKDLFEKFKISERKAEKYLFAGVFGSIYPEANIEKVLDELLLRAKSCNQEVVFVSFGRIGSVGQKEIERLTNLFVGKIKFINCGELSQERISTLLQLLDIGISCTPSQHVGKSGVFAAMKFHGLEVLMSSGDEIPEYEEQLQKMMPVFINRPSEMWGVQYVASDFMSYINN
jgi:hypothetical protein